MSSGGFCSFNRHHSRYNGQRFFASTSNLSVQCIQQPQLSVEIALPVVNIAFQLLGVSSISKKKINSFSGSLVNKKINEMCHNLRQSLGSIDDKSIFFYQR